MNNLKAIYVPASFRPLYVVISHYIRFQGLQNLFAATAIKLTDTRLPCTITQNSNAGKSRNLSASFVRTRRKESIV